ncbi:3-oxoacyl-ACP reductase FabG [Sutcliffiella cohnii]|uniref:3-oxoacyl-ACP reductase n=1 Tax=Sutcliffiella cohnii TaxID=33932 RepID=A0A223KMI4_9BACI|nr:MULTISPECIES: 3-oxoacyl-ACP reductase FabG [Sutcliffiella]AST90533.1 3-oxoacyl-ACP reductase [Sutcliffiella cohnii]WBL16182.1 3-oxoacyl-ACP reductase FabG [Sutcliffiella sp. NC1]
MRLEGKVAIITGAANGLGLEAATIFGREGAKVALVDYDKELGEKRANELIASGFEAAYYQVNVAEQSEVQSMVNSVKERWGKIDILINNAGITRDSMLLKMDASDFQKVMDVNVNGVFHCTQAVVPHMIEQGKGKIINTSSVSGVYGNVGQTNYAASKAAVVGMTKTWAKEFGRKGINVNAVAPGFIETNMVATVPDKVIQSLIQVIPLQRLGQPSDIANAYLYLASDESDYVNGTVLHVDGGIMM